MKYFDIINKKTALLEATLQEPLVTKYLKAKNRYVNLFIAVERDPKKKSKFTHRMSQAGTIRLYGPV